jgi:hypothetical protein
LRRRLIISPLGVTSQETASSIVAAVRAPNPAYIALTWTTRCLNTCTRVNALRCGSVALRTRPGGTGNPPRHGRQLSFPPSRSLGPDAKPLEPLPLRIQTPLRRTKTSGHAAGRRCSLEESRRPTSAERSRGPNWPPSPQLSATPLEPAGSCSAPRRPGRSMRTAGSESADVERHEERRPFLLRNISLATILLCRVQCHVGTRPFSLAASDRRDSFGRNLHNRF